MKKTNKLISILLVVAMLLSMAPLTVFAATVEASGKFGASGNNLTWSLDSDGVLTVSGSGEMEDFANASKVPWYSKRTKVKTVVIESGVTNIGKDAFYGISTLTNATISDTVTSIGNRAFSGSGLTNFEFSDAGNLKTIGNTAFSNTKIKSMVIPDGVTTLGSYVFGYGPIQSVTIPASVTSVGNYFFEETSSLNEVIFLGNKEPETIGNTVFLGCSSLAYVSVPADYEGDTFSNMMVSKAAASVAEVNGQGFATLADAISAAKSINGAELKLLSHISIDSGITIESGNFTIDLNGKELFSNGYYLLRVDGADITIADSAGGGIFNATNDQGNIVLEVLSGSANISGGTFNSAGYPATVRDGTLKLTGKDFVLNGNWRIGWYGGSIDLSACTADEVRIQACADGLQASEVTLPDGWGLFKTDGTPCTDFVKNDIYVAKAGFKVTASVNPAEGGTVEGAGTYSSGATVNLTASVANGYRFVNWIENGEEVSTSAVYTFTASENREITANFEIVPHTHSFTYSASGDTITAVCANTDGNCPDPEGTLTILAPADLYVDGTAKEATVENNLVDTSVAISDITYSAPYGLPPKDAGTYTASVTVGGATASVEFELIKRSAAAENFVYTAPENLVYDGTAKYATVEVSPEITGLGEITVSYYKDGEAVEPINAGTYTVKVSTAESDKYYAINDIELASFTIAAKDISDGFIILGEALTYNGTEQTQTVEKVLPTGTNPEATYTVSGNKATNVGVYLLTVTGTGNFTGEAKIAYEIAVDMNGVDFEQLHPLNVKATDREKIEYIFNQVDNAVTDLASDEKKAEWNNLRSTCVELLKMIESVEDHIESFENDLAKYDIDTVTSDDAADLESFQNSVGKFYNDYYDNLTDEQEKKITDIYSVIEDLETRISDVAEKITRITNAVNGYDEATVKYGDYKDILQLIDDIETLTTGKNITDFERADLEELNAKANLLAAKIRSTADEIARITRAVNAYSIDTVKSSDKADIENLIARIRKLTDGDNITADERANLNELDSTLDALLAKIDETADELARLEAEVGKYDKATVKSSDRADIEQLIADIKHLTDGQNLTAEEREYLVNADAECDKLLAKIAETTAEYDRVIAAANGYDEATVTSANKNALIQLDTDIFALALTNNVTAEEKNSLMLAHSNVFFCIQRITYVSDEIKRIVEELEKYVFDSVKSSDKADVEQLVADIKALLDTQNITADERALLEGADETCDMLIAKIDETVAEINHINDATNAYDIDTVTSADKADIEKLLDDIKALTDGDNVTDAEREQLNGNEAALKALLDKIGATADEIARIETAVNDYDEESVKSTDKADLEQLKADIKVLTDATNITGDERTKLGELDAKIDTLIKKIDDTVKEIERIENAVNGYDEETVKSSDKADLEQLVEDIKALDDGNNVTEDEKVALDEADKAIDEFIEKLAEVAEEIKRVDEAVKSYDEETVKSTDSENLAQLKEDIQSLIDGGNTTENEKTALGEMIEEIETLEEKIEEIETQLERIAGIENFYNPETVTSDDKVAIQKTIDEIEAVNPDNLTDEQKAEYDEIKAELEALLEEIAAAENAVADIGAEFEMFDEKRVTIFWKDEIEALKAKIDELLADENMGKAEKEKLNEYKAQCDNLIEIINTPIKYFSFRFFYLIWDFLVWAFNGILWLFSKIFA